VPFAFAIVALAVAMSSGQLGLGASISAVITLSVLGPASFLLIALGAPEPHPPPGGGNFWLGAFVCFDITLSWAAVPLLAAALSLRHTYPVAAGWRAALVGAASGLFSGAVMNLHCPSVDRFHIALGHGIPVLVATIIGAIVVSRWVRI
jgi:negative regulator of sigma F NrsF-like protein